ncbi:ISL3 family transposase [Noviherbaspirillum pedocola]|uniref:ISL3 family transposase n=1 Tax=Noviherbaspirillum pedocola TaxID=2801341 RepID=A0A934SZ03_9BURK|nr:ISL3 family transposase [Noviherbaspirillum pedocola]MBK4735542.1 ISL3 family transposase [Noviherbaspirillum pedocola]
MNSILDLPGWSIVGKRVDDLGYEFQAEFATQPQACTKCGTVGRLYKHGLKAATYRDSPIRGKPVRILANVQRYKCRECGETFQQPLAGMEDGRLMTQRCAGYIAEQSLIDPFTTIARHLGVNETTVRTIAQEHIQRIVEAREPPEAHYLGIDAVSIGQRVHAIFTDVGNRRVIDLLASRDKRSVAHWLNDYRHRTGITAVAMDMWRPYREVSQDLLPGVPVVIDKFHLVKLATKGLENVRRRLCADRSSAVKTSLLRSRPSLLRRAHKLTEKQRQSRDMTLEKVPELREAYELKESLLSIYELPKDEASRECREWLKRIPKGMAKDFEEIRSALRDWRPEIFNYFDHPITNGYTEAVHSVAKASSRVGRGYSFDVLRARILLNELAMPTPEIEKAVEAETEDCEHDRWQIVDRFAERAFARQKLLAELGNRCSCCLGRFNYQQLQVEHLKAIVPGEHTSAMTLVCSSCNRRFRSDQDSGDPSTSIF